MKRLKTALLLAPICLFADGEIPETQKAVTPFIEYHNRMAVFGPFHQVYERIKTDALYVGVEGWLLPVKSSQRSDELFDAELRFGYNLFYKGRHHLTPLAGVGVVKGTKRFHYNSTLFEGHEHKHHGAIPAVVYGALGFLYDYEFNSVFNLGFNLKGLVGGAVDKKHINWGSTVVGFDASVPITFRFGHKRHWDIRIEPFDMLLHGTNVTINYFGFRSTIGYRF